MTWTNLHDACLHQDALKVISRSRSNPEEAKLVDDHGSTPLHIASSNCGGEDSPPKRRQNAEIFRALVKADPNAVMVKDKHGSTPLHLLLYHSAHHIDLESVKCLLTANPSVATVPDMEGLLPLHVACRHCSTHAEVIAHLICACPSAASKHIKMGELVTKKDDSPLQLKHDPRLHTIVDGTNRTVKDAGDLRFIDRFHSQVRDGAYPLHMAIASGAPLNVIRLLTKACPDVLLLSDKYGRTPLHVAVHRCSHADGSDTDDARKDILRFLIHADMAALRKADRMGRLPIHRACSQENPCFSVVTLLVHAYPSSVVEVDKDGKQPLDLARLHSADDRTIAFLQLEMNNENRGSI